MTESSLSLRLEKHRPAAVEQLPQSVDRWIASSALQKAVRRGHEDEALRCARLLVEVDPQRLWRRLAVIAMEDVGVGGITAVADTVLAARSKTWRDQNGGDWHVASYLVHGLCTAPKSRDADDLGIVAVLHPGYAQSRAELACAPEATLSEIVADATQPLPLRCLAALYIDGTNEWTVKELPRRRGDLRRLLEVYRHAGLPGYVCDAVENGAKKGRGTLPVNLGLLWLQATNARSRTVRDERAGLTHLGTINGLSSEAYDMHTRDGKRALTYFMKSCEPVRKYLSRFVPEREIYGMIAGLAWHAESSLVDRRLVYDGSEDILEMAKIANLASDDFPVESVEEAIELMRRHLPDLHRARLRILESGTGP